jgi:1-aminocyclopropane-1-carboxylate deaminase/D-cysteine desulfhydrase-like pyridoxal-dependent ACC family enzyme
MNTHTHTFHCRYAPVAWTAIMEHWKELSDHELIYVHCGGLEGNDTQISRYFAKFLMDK